MSKKDYDNKLEYTRFKLDDSCFSTSWFFLMAKSLEIRMFWGQPSRMQKNRAYTPSDEICRKDKKSILKSEAFRVLVWKSDSLGCISWVHRLWPLWWRISMSIRVQTMLNLCRFFEQINNNNNNNNDKDDNINNINSNDYRSHYPWHVISDG